MHEDNVRAAIEPQMTMIYGTEGEILCAIDPPATTPKKMIVADKPVGIPRRRKSEPVEQANIADIIARAEGVEGCPDTLKGYAVYCRGEFANQIAYVLIPRCEVAKYDLSAWRKITQRNFRRYRASDRRTARELGCANYNRVYAL